MTEYHPSGVSEETRNVNEPELISYLSRCHICGRELVFHLCPDCDSTILRTRQSRLELAIKRVRAANEIKRQTLQSRILKRDTWAHQELENHIGKPGKRSSPKFIIGVIFSVPMTLIGLEMVMDSYYIPIGIALILCGTSLLLHSVFTRMASENHKYATKWLNLTMEEKIRSIEKEAEPANSHQNHNCRTRSFNT